MDPTLSLLLETSILPDWYHLQCDLVKSTLFNRICRLMDCLGAKLIVFLSPYQEDLHDLHNPLPPKSESSSRFSHEEEVL